LAAAHAAGVTHRDLKPENVMVTRDGRAKLLDFGVATASRAPGPGDLTVGQTDIGVVVGTAGYMAPEQVRGEPVDHRTDIFAFGTLLYELLSGKRAFTGDTAVETMTAIIKHDPSELPSSIPAPVRQIIHRCLEKHADERFQSARDLAFALRQATSDSGTAAAISVPASRDRRRMWPIVAASLTAGVATGMLSVQQWTSAQQALIDPVRLTRFTSHLLTEGLPAFSPDGRSIAYRRISPYDTSILVQALDAAAPVVLVKSSVALNALAWTADGTRVCYRTVERHLMCVGATGGTPQRLLGDVSNPRFTRDGKSLLLVRAGDGGPALFVSAPPGAEPIRRTDLPLPRDFNWFELSPDGSKLLVRTDSGLTVMDLTGGGGIRNLESPQDGQPSTAAWLPDNRHIAFSELTRDPIGFRLVLADTESPSRRLVYRDVAALGELTVSPDGMRIAFSSGQPEWDVHEYSMTGAYSRPLATSSNMDRFPDWSPRGDAAVFIVGGPGRPDELWTSPASGVDSSRLLTLADRGLLWSQPRLSPDGKRIAWSDETTVWTMSASGGRPIAILRARDVTGVCWSPDGEWIWYSSGPPPTLHKVQSHGGDPVMVRSSVGRVHDCSPDGRWISAGGRSGPVLVSTDGRDERPIASILEYASQADNTMQFGEGGQVLYALMMGRRAIAIIDVATLKPRRTVTFPIAPHEMIQGFAVHPDATRVLLTTGLQRDDIWIAEGYAQPATGWRRWIQHWQPPHGSPRQQ
jgi:Tol biopolymer transport system component